jgi:hypothetical protein
VCLVANGPEPKAPKNPETNSLDIAHDEKRQEKHRIHQFFSSLLGHPKRPTMRRVIRRSCAPPMPVYARGDPISSTQNRAENRVA